MRLVLDPLRILLVSWKISRAIGSRRQNAYLEVGIELGVLPIQGYS